MARIPTPIPQSIVRSLRRLMSGSTGDTLWKLLVIVALLTSVIALASMGTFFAGFAAAAILGALLNDDIRAFVSDVWNRDFWVFRT